MSEACALDSRTTTTVTAVVSRWDAPPAARAGVAAGLRRRPTRRRCSPLGRGAPPVPARPGAAPRRLFPPLHALAEDGHRASPPGFGWSDAPSKHDHFQ